MKRNKYMMKRNEGMNNRDEGTVREKGKGGKAKDLIMRTGEIMRTVEITRLGMIVELKCKGGNEKRGERNGKRGEWEGDRKS